MEHLRGHDFCGAGMDDVSDQPPLPALSAPMPIGFGTFKNAVGFAKKSVATKKQKPLKCRVCNKVDKLTVRHVVGVLCGLTSEAEKVLGMLSQNMFAPCDCYKKREDGLVHWDCLKALVETSQNRHDNMVKPKCPICNKEFRGFARHQIVWSRLCSEKGFDVIFQLATMVIMMVCCLGVGTLVYMDDKRPDDPEHPRRHKHQKLSEGEKKMFVVMGFLMILMFIATLKKVHERWVRVARPLVMDEAAL